MSTEDYRVLYVLTGPTLLALMWLGFWIYVRSLRPPRVRTPTVQHILVVGNPVDGLQFIGPFGDAEDAFHFADRMNLSEWWCSSLEDPVDDDPDEVLLAPADAAPAEDLPDE